MTKPIHKRLGMSGRCWDDCPACAYEKGGSEGKRQIVGALSKYLRAQLETSGRAAKDKGDERPEYALFFAGAVSSCEALLLLVSVENLELALREVKDETDKS